MQILFARLNFFVEIKELLAFGLECLVVALAGLHMHAKQIVNETEDLQEHGESVLAHESKLERHVEYSLSKLAVCNCEAACACKDITTQFIFIGEDKLAAGVARSNLPGNVLFHLV